MLPAPSNVRHLYRALLRESTYLPDPIARPFVRGHIISSFRRHNPRKEANTGESESKNKGKGKGDDESNKNAGEKQAKSHHDLGLDPTRKYNLLRRARKGLYALRRANDGHEYTLLRVLRLSYGQIGRLRNKRLALLVKSEENEGEDERKKAETRRSLARKHQVGDKHTISPKLDALYENRRQHKDRFQVHSPTAFGGPPKIPETNIWGRPLPQKRLRNLQRKRYARILDGVCPPLPRNEWDTLVVLATDRNAWGGPIPRRPRGLTTDEQSTDDTTLSTLLNGRFLINGPQKGHKTYEPRLGSPHKLTRRYMQHIWHALLKESCCMTWDSEKKTWHIEWGCSIPRRKPSGFVQLVYRHQDPVLFQNL